MTISLLQMRAANWWGKQWEKTNATRSRSASEIGGELWLWFTDNEWTADNNVKIICYSLAMFTFSIPLVYSIKFISKLPTEMTVKNWHHQTKANDHRIWTRIEVLKPPTIAIPTTTSTEYRCWCFRSVAALTGGGIPVLRNSTGTIRCDAWQIVVVRKDNVTTKSSRPSAAVSIFILFVSFLLSN